MQDVEDSIIPFDPDFDIAAMMAEIEAMDLDDPGPPSDVEYRKSAPNIRLENRKTTPTVEASEMVTKTNDINDFAQIGAHGVDHAPSVYILPSLTPPSSTSTHSCPSPTVSIKEMFDGYWRKRSKAAQARRYAPVRFDNWEDGDPFIETMDRPSRWKDANEMQRRDFYSLAIINTGCPVAFTLNISQTLADRSGKAKHGALDHLRRIISRRLSAVLGASPDLVVALEFTEEGRPHLHGLVAWPSGDLVALVNVLKLAGGEWESRRGAENQVEVCSDHEKLKGNHVIATRWPLDTGWLRYSFKEEKRTRSLTSRSAIYATNESKRRAQELYQAEVARLRRMPTSLRDYLITLPEADATRDDAAFPADRSAAGDHITC